MPHHFYNAVSLFFYFVQRNEFNPLRANPTKSSNTLKQFVCNLPTNCLSVFDHFVILALKGLITFRTQLRSILPFPVGIYPFKVNFRNTTTRCEICWHHSRVFMVNFEHISYLILVFLLLTLNMQLLTGFRSRILLVNVCKSRLYRDFAHIY